MKKLVLVLVAGLMMASCGTLFASKYAEIPVDSTPGQAEVYVNGDKMTMTPGKLRLKKNKDYRIEFRLKGYDPVVKHINSKIDGLYLVLDILGGGIPIIVDAATGNWSKLDQENVKVFLNKSKM